jgi:hypothetical protein
MAEIELKGGFKTSDPRLDRLPQFDERSRGYPIRALVTEQAPLRSRGWACPTWLDQGQEGACVGFSWSHELCAYPVPVGSIDDEFARRLQRGAAARRVAGRGVLGHLRPRRGQGGLGEGLHG